MTLKHFRFSTIWIFPPFYFFPLNFADLAIISYNLNYFSITIIAPSILSDKSNLSAERPTEDYRY